MAKSNSTFHLNDAAEAAFGYSQAVRASNLLFVSGTISVNEKFEPIENNSMARQFTVIYQDLQKTLAAHGLNFSNVVKETIFVEDLGAFIESANEVRKKFYADCAFPATTAVQVSRIAFEGNLVEIELIAQFP